MKKRYYKTCPVCNGPMAIKAKTCQPCRIKLNLHSKKTVSPTIFLDAEPVREMILSAMIRNEETKTSLAEKSHVNVRNVRGFLNGYTNYIHTTTADKLCTALGIQLETGEHGT